MAGAVPAALGWGPGAEARAPMARAVIGGLITSTFCEFLIHPGLFWRFSGQDAERLARSGPADAETLLDHS